MKLEPRYVEKPWGRMLLPPMFNPPAGERVGEVWFTNGTDLPLLAKYIFTSERLSIQVHPDDQQARERGLRQGKSECWYILDAGADSTLGLGLKRKVGEHELRKAALDGSIEDLMDWKPVHAGDFVFVPSGTVHAIGAGISLLEFQQNSDVTYRLYDYGRPRQLHLEDGVAVSDARPFPHDLIQHLSKDDERMLVDGPHFTLLVTRGDALRNRLRWVLPLEGEVQASGCSGRAGDCLLLRPGEALESAGARMLIGASAMPS